jgi:hypothetical protein
MKPWWVKKKFECLGYMDGGFAFLGLVTPPGARGRRAPRWVAGGDLK